MTDQEFSNEFYIDSAFTIKPEPLSMDALLHTASVPIPTRRGMDFSDLRDFEIDDANRSPGSNVFQEGGNSSLPTLYSSNSLWGTKIAGPEADIIKMEDDDIFQVDKSDLIQGPTLAELNANDETLGLNDLDDLNFDELLLPDDNNYYIQVPQQNVSVRISPFPQVLNPTPTIVGQSCASSFPPDSLGFYKDTLSSSVPSSPFNSQGYSKNLSPASHHSSHSSSSLQGTPPPHAVSPLQHKHSTLHELLMKKDSSNSTPLGQSMPGPSMGGVVRNPRYSQSRLSSSAPTHTHLGPEQIWQRREPRQHLLSTGSLAEGGSTSSLSTGGVLSPEAHDFSLDESFDSEDDSDHYDDFSSDAESLSDGETGGGGRSSKRERYFWQYNLQAKGPKGQRLVLAAPLEDPHCLNQITDPVFSPQCAVQGIKHSGKARKGDGNDLTPNPRKLNAIGKELDKLTRTINEMTPVSELPFNIRSKSRKEKNKLASRACRLKKKAQHEANKIKLQGLETEHKRLITGINQLKHVLVARCVNESTDPAEFTKTSDKIVKTATKLKVAGQTTDFVNKVLDKVKQGTASGGLDDL